MHRYRVTKEMDLHAFVHTRFCPLVGPPAVPETFLVSKELMVYLETLVDFSQYYRVDDPRMPGKMKSAVTSSPKVGDVVEAGPLPAGSIVTK